MKEKEKLQAQADYNGMGVVNMVERLGYEETKQSNDGQGWEKNKWKRDPSLE